MFPVNDLNLVVCGIATFAATVGYACSRKLAALPPTIARDAPDHVESMMVHSPKTEETSGPSVSDNSSQDFEQDTKAQVPEKLTTAPNRSWSLKRKREHDHDDVDADAGYPHNLSLIYPPKKRSRTPSSESDTEVIKEKSVPSSPVEKCDDTTATPASTAEDNVEATPRPSTPEPPSPPRVSETLITPSPVFGSPATITSPLPKSSLRPSQRTVTCSAFSTFAGSTSPFSTITPSKTGRPAWTANSDAWKGPNEEASDPPSDDVEESATSLGPNDHVLVAAVTSKSTLEHVTGEESEDVALELKGVRLFMKRGDKPFLDGMVGHVKLLSDKTTHEERLLFRREPLWQVSMNVRMHPTIRCIFDAEENVLRLILKEVVEQKGVPPQDWKREVVIYVLKPGRSCSKQDFKDFGNSLVGSRALKAQ